MGQHPVRAVQHEGRSPHVGDAGNSGDPLHQPRQGLDRDGRLQDAAKGAVRTDDGLSHVEGSRPQLSDEAHVRPIGRGPAGGLGQPRGHRVRIGCRTVHRDDLPLKARLAGEPQLRIPEEQCEDLRRCDDGTLQNVGQARPIVRVDLTAAHKLGDEANLLAHRVEVGAHPLRGQHAEHVRVPRVRLDGCASGGVVHHQQHAERGGQDQAADAHAQQQSQAHRAPSTAGGRHPCLLMPSRHRGRRRHHRRRRRSGAAAARRPRSAHDGRAADTRPTTRPADRAEAVRPWLR